MFLNKEHADKCMLGQIRKVIDRNSQSRERGTDPTVRHVLGRKAATQVQMFKRAKERGQI